MNNDRANVGLVRLKDGRNMPRLGQGTWHMGERHTKRSQEVEALRYGIELGMCLIDTAEMYAEGGAEKIVGEAIGGFDREKLFLVSKVYPHHAGRGHIFASCEASLKRMKTDYLDMYLLHWRGSIPLAETAACMEELKAQGKIRGWGVSNFDSDDILDLHAQPGGQNCLTDQVLYHLGSRGIEYDLLPLLENEEIPVMAYCPIASGGRLGKGLLENAAVKTTAEKHSATAAQILLAFVLRLRGMAAIPKASKKAHVLENAQAANIALDAEDMERLNIAYPSPAHKVPLDIE
ncbi:MAG: aldo/keto reductase [Christensenellaceae bacterium]|jgi:diketogulonate reductase-like aldo/keto reductase